MRSPLRPFPKPLIAAGLLATSLIGTACLAPVSSAQTSPPSGATPSTQSVPTKTSTLGVPEARAAANAILEAIKKGDANARYNQFSDELKAVTSPQMVQNTMRTQPKLLSWKLLSVNAGLRNTTVEASLLTTKGNRDVFIVLNGAGKIVGYHFDRADQASSQVALDFVKTLGNGQYISARSFLSLDLQKEITPDRLQQKWQELQQFTGNYVKVKKAVEATSNGSAELVLVLTEFNRLSDSLFVILDKNNQITGVDFPIDPSKPQPAR
jgi:hypothetical protein